MMTQVLSSQKSTIKLFKNNLNKKTVRKKTNLSIHPKKKINNKINSEFCFLNFQDYPMTKMPTAQ